MRGCFGAETHEYSMQQIDIDTWNILSRPLHRPSSSTIGMEGGGDGERSTLCDGWKVEEEQSTGAHGRPADSFRGQTFLEKIFSSDLDIRGKEFSLVSTDNRSLFLRQKNPLEKKFCDSNTPV